MRDREPTRNKPTNGGVSAEQTGKGSDAYPEQDGRIGRCLSRLFWAITFVLLLLFASQIVVIWRLNRFERDAAWKLCAAASRFPMWIQKTKDIERKLWKMSKGENVKLFSKSLRNNGAFARIACKRIGRHPNHHSLYLLLALRQTNPRSYYRLSPELRARVLCSALKESGSLDLFYPCNIPGNPGRSRDGLKEREIGGKALVEVGPPAMDFIGQVIDEKEAVDRHDRGITHQAYYFGERRCDHAYRYGAMILGEEIEWSSCPGRRDYQWRQVISGTEKDVSPKQRGDREERGKESR